MLIGQNPCVCIHKGFFFERKNRLPSAAHNNAAVGALSYRNVKNTGPMAPKGDKCLIFNFRK
ncbi:MAG: hypothetical protein D6730_19965 [Bacteroidetes bacterium]|nr:MAG: hypothetical protein D6730_19965 [Bacteroidota bacterium]